MNNRNIPGTRNQIEEKAPQSRREERRLHNRKRAQQREILQTALLLAAAVILLCLSFVEGGGPWRAIHNIFRGLFGGYAPLWAVIPGGLVVLSAFDQKHNVRRSTFSLGVCVVIFALCTASFVFSLDQNFGEFSYLQNMGQLYLDGIAGNGAGSVGGLLGLPIFGLLGATGAKIVIILLFLAAILIFVIKKIGGLDLGTNDREPVPEREARQPEPFTRQEPSRRASVRQPQESPRRPEPQIHTPRMTSIDVPIDPEPAAVRPSGKPAAAESSKPAALEELEKELDRFIAEPIPVRSAPKAAAPVGNAVTAPPKVSSVQQVRTSQVRPQPSKPVYISPYTASRPSVISQPASQKTNPVVTTPAAASASPVSRPADPVPDKQPEKAESLQETVPAEKESIWKILTETADNQAASGEPPVIRIPEYQGEEPEIPQEESMTESASEAEDQREILNEINAVLDDSVPAGDFEPETQNFPPIQRVSVESVPVEPVSMDEKQSASLDAPAEVPEISQQSSSDVPDSEQPVGQESFEAEQEPAPESYSETAVSVSDSDLSMETSETVRDFPQPIDESEQDDFDDFEDDAEDNFFGAISAALDGIGFSVPEDVDIPNPDPVETPEPEVSEEADPTSEESAEMLEPDVSEEAPPTPEEPAETPEMEAPEKASPTPDESAETLDPEASEEASPIPDESAEELGMEALEEATPVPEESVETSEKVTSTSEESIETPEPEVSEEAASIPEEPAETPEPEVSEEAPPTPEEPAETPEPEVFEEAASTPEESVETPESEASEEVISAPEESAETPEPEASEEVISAPEEFAKTPEPEAPEESASTSEESAGMPEPEAPEKVTPVSEESVETSEPEASEEASSAPEESAETPKQEMTEKAVPTPDQSTETPEPEAPEEAAPTSEESAETSEPEASEETASIPEESVKTPNSEESEEAVSTIEEAPKSQETEIPQEPAVSEEQDPWEKIPAAVQEIPMEIDLQPEPEEVPAKDFEPDPWEEVPAGKAESISDEANSPAEVTDEVTEKSAGENSEEDPWADIPEGTEKEKSSAALETTPYQRPPASLLEYSAQQDDAQMQEELQTNGDHLIDTLKSFGVQATMLDISRGPAVTRYELQPAAGVKISKITNLADDIAMNLAAPGVRIEAPIPGKAAVGIEVPNKKVNTVRMRELVESKEFLEAESPLTVALGRDIAGKITLANLAKMPHLLIAGSTGSGKSVCINSLIVSLLYKSSPDQVRFLMIDPKVVELGIYNGIPQLLVPVVTDPRKAAGALNWAVSEMLKRYQLFADNSVRDLGAYNRLAKENGYQDDDGQPMPALPQIVIIIDELADLMMAAPNDVENAICRLAQMARAAGMHLVIATQRPSVDVITGIIKANIPSRIAFAVSSQIDSRTILDMGGAEKLLGRGDMLFSPMGVQKPMRVQGCFVSDGEIESVVKFVKGTQDALYDSTILDEIERSAVQENEKSADDDSSGGDMDPMLQDAIKCVAEAGQASASLLQRRLRLGYARAGRLIDEMEDMGIIGPREGSKPRQVLITYQQYLEMSVNREE